jgi:hypothetical protein
VGFHVGVWDTVRLVVCEEREKKEKHRPTLHAELLVGLSGLPAHIHTNTTMHTRNAKATIHGQSIAHRAMTQAAKSSPKCHLRSCDDTTFALHRHACMALVATCVMGPGDASHQTSFSKCKHRLMSLKSHAVKAQQKPLKIFPPSVESRRGMVVGRRSVCHCVCASVSLLGGNDMSCFHRIRSRLS